MKPKRRKKTPPVTVYLIHFAKPYKHARHYLGSAENLEARLTEHKAGRGARLLQVITAAGIDFEVVRTWNGTRATEAKFKRAHHNCRLCPKCRKEIA